LAIGDTAFINVLLKRITFLGFGMFFVHIGRAQNVLSHDEIEASLLIHVLVCGL